MTVQSGKVTRIVARYDPIDWDSFSASLRGVEDEWIEVLFRGTVRVEFEKPIGGVVLEFQTTRDHERSLNWYLSIRASGPMGVLHGVEANREVREYAVAAFLERYPQPLPGADLFAEELFRLFAQEQERREGSTERFKKVVRWFATLGKL